jgi:hypothetical protein
MWRATRKLSAASPHFLRVQGAELLKPVKECAEIFCETRAEQRGTECTPGVLVDGDAIRYGQAHSGPPPLRRSPLGEMTRFAGS